MDAPAYLNWGRWVCDCPRWPDCTTSMLITPGETAVICRGAGDSRQPEGCGLAYTVTWPPGDLGPKVAAALASRPEKQRSWFPAGHPRAAAQGQPHGQTIAQLDDETAWLATRPEPGPAATRQREQIDEALAGLGLHLGADGFTLEGL